MLLFLFHFNSHVVAVTPHYAADSRRGVVVRGGTTRRFCFYIRMSFVFSLDRMFRSTCIGRAAKQERGTRSPYTRMCVCALCMIQDPPHSLFLSRSFRCRGVCIQRCLSASFSPHSQFSCRFVIKLNRPVFWTVLASSFVLLRRILKENKKTSSRNEYAPPSSAPISTLKLLFRFVFSISSKRYLTSHSICKHHYKQTYRAVDGSEQIVLAYIAVMIAVLVHTRAQAYLLHIFVSFFFFCLFVEARLFLLLVFALFFCRCLAIIFICCLRCCLADCGGMLPHSGFCCRVFISVFVVCLPVLGKRLLFLRLWFLPFGCWFARCNNISRKHLRTVEDGERQQTETRRTGRPAR